MMRRMKEHLEKAITICHGQTALAAAIKGWHAARGREIKMSQANVWNWLNRSKGVVPAEHCPAIEFAVGEKVTRYDLRPDVFGPSPDSSSAQTPQQEAA